MADADAARDAGTGAALDPDCIFCSIASGAAGVELVHEGERVVVFRDISPAAPVHLLVIPRAHHRTVGDLAAADPQAMVELVTAARQSAVAEGHDSFRLVFNTGERAGQSVFHVHGHVLAGRALTWPPG